MNTLIFNLNDTVAMSDSTLIELTKLVNSSQPVMQEAGTSCNDVWIAFLICASVVTVLLCGICKFFTYKVQELRDQEAENKKRNNDVEDRRWKQRSDLMDKLLDRLKNQASGKSGSKVGTGNTRSIKEEEIYKSLLEIAAESNVGNLRKKYTELCVDILQRPGKGDNVEANPKQEEVKQVEKTDHYLNALCTLLGMIDKKEMSDDDIEKLKKSCGIIAAAPTATTTATTTTTEHTNPGQ